MRQNLIYNYFVIDAKFCPVSSKLPGEVVNEKLWENCCQQQKVIDLFSVFKGENASTRFSDRQLFLMDYTKYISVRCMSKQSSIKKRRREKVCKSSTRKVVDCIWSRVSTALNLKENGFLSVTIMMCPQQNELHSLLEGNLDNINEAGSTENWFVYIFLLTNLSCYVL